ncbi:cytochrome P450 [Multifurca ochricompacta]|uniref:Cytochrome P450 n=1 Tax=Multifurca ochricompacta TaxID=376703 RepID=A0AAD4LY17_9AGAM|nr:cytochrome P450 [Multifurca ochricompacta]
MALYEPSRLYTLREWIKANWLPNAYNTSGHTPASAPNSLFSAISSVSKLPVLETFLKDRTLVTGLLLTLILVFITSYLKSPWRKLPPGPPRIPILGNMSQLRNMKWLFSTDCKGRFSEVMHLDAMGRQTIVFNSLKSAYNILERRAGNYSGRPRFIMAQEILNQGLGMALMDYGELWRRLRRAAHDAVSRTTVQNYHPTQTKEATILVSALLDDPENRHSHFQRASASVILSICDWWGSPEFQCIIIAKPRPLPLSDPEMMFLSGETYNQSIAGFETTSTTLMWWTFAMVAFPQVQRRAQAELDAVVGRSRLPTFADAPHLPYVRAVIREVLRWRPPIPSGVPHSATEDDWYEGMFIPKGAYADDFRPERHLGEGGELLPGPIETNQEGHVSFGFGRRICVGKYLANDTLFISTARMLWATTIESVMDENGKEVVPDTDGFTDMGGFIHPIPYDCRIRPRFPEVVSTLSEECERIRED